MAENAKVIQDAYAAFGRGDIEAVLKLVADDCDWRGPQTKDIPYSGVYRGNKGAAKFFDGIMSNVKVTAFEPKTFVAQGDDVMTTGSWSGVALPTGKPFNSIWAMHFKVVRGKIAYAQTYEETALTAAAFRK